MLKQIASLTPRHFKIVDLTIKGYGVGQIATELNMTRVMVSIVTHSPTFKHELAIRRAIYEEKVDDKMTNDEDDVLKTLKTGAIAAANKLVAHVDSDDESISVKSCAEILDRSGYGKKKDETNINIGPTIVVSESDAKRLVESISLSK